MRGQFLQNISINNGNVHKEPHETTPPLFRFSSSHVVAPHLIAQVYTAHVVVVCLHDWGAGNLNDRSIALSSTDSVVPHGIRLRAQKIYRLLIFPYGNDNVLFAKEQRLSSTKSLDSLSLRGDCTQDALSISTNGSADINLISKQIFSESKRIKKIIDKNMVIFAYQGSSKLADNAVSESLFRIAIALFSRVDFQIANEAVQRICTLPHFDSPLYRF